jgi:aminopeptidase N
MAHPLLLASLLGLAMVADPPPARARAFPTLDESQHFPRTRRFDLMHTRVEIEIDPSARRVFGTATVTVAALAQPLHAVVLDAVDLRIREVRLEGGGALAWEYDGSRLLARLPAPAPEGERVSIAVDYQAEPKEGMYFVLPDAAHPDRPIQVWTQGESEYTRHWVPGYDFPDDLGTSELLVTVPKPLEVLSNGLLVETAELDAGRWRWHWRQEAPMATYLMMLAVADWEVKRETWRGIEVSFYYQARHAEMVARSFAPTRAMLDFYSDGLGVPYPWPKYSQVVVADFMWGGMENTSATVLTEETLHDARGEPDYSSQDLIAHELAHQWFGDLLTARGWAEIWLNEGFATYFGTLWREKAEGWDAFIASLHDELAWLEEELESYRRPIVTHAYQDPDDMFDAHSYAKGAWVLHALRGWLDDDRLWWRAMGRWVADHRHQAVETSELRRSLEATTGRGLGRFFEQWVYRAGLPKLEVSYEWDPEERRLAVEIAQTQERDRWVPLFVLPIDVRLRLPSGEVVTRRVWLEESKRSYDFDLAARPTVIEIDPRGFLPAPIEIAYPRLDALAALKDGSTVVTRRRAVERLAQQGGDPEVARALAAQARKDFWWVAAAAAEALEKLNHPAALEGLLELADHAHPKARAAVAEALEGYRGGPRVEEVLRRLLEDRSYLVIAAAAKTYARAAGQKAVPRLASLAAMRSPHEDVARAALAGLGHTAGAAAWREALRRAGPAEPRRVRSAAFQALGEIGAREPARSSEAKELLLRGLRDQELWVRAGAAQGLAMLGDPSVAPALRVVAETDPRIRVKRAARDAADELTKLDRARGSLVERLEDEEAARRTLERRLDALEGRLGREGERR